MPKASSSIGGDKIPADTVDESVYILCLKVLCTSAYHQCDGQPFRPLIGQLASQFHFSLEMNKRGRPDIPSLPNFGLQTSGPIVVNAPQKMVSESIQSNNADPKVSAFGHTSSAASQETKFQNIKE